MFHSLVISVVTTVPTAAFQVLGSTESDALITAGGLAVLGTGAAIVAQARRRQGRRHGERRHARSLDSTHPEELRARAQRDGRGERYANVNVLHEDAKSRLDVPEPNQIAVLRVDIGALDPESRVESPVQFPDDVLPQEDVTIDVVLTSSDFSVGLNTEELRVASGVEQRLRLPANGGSAVNEDDGEAYVDFLLRAPDRRGHARARLSYLFRNTVLQSQRIDVELGVELHVTTDFTLSATLGPDVRAIRPRSRVTILSNENAGQHRFVVRAAGANGAPLTDPCEFPIEHDRIAKPVADLRRGLAQVAPRSRKRGRGQLLRDLKRLAPLGRKLYHALDPRIQDAVRDTAKADPSAVLQVALAQGSTFTLPWSFVYDIHLPDRTSVERLNVCPVISNWDEQGPMVLPDGARRCPHADDVDHVQGLLCPFGFWGFRYAIETLGSRDKPELEIRCPPDTRILIGETEKGVKRERLQDHVKALHSAFAAAVPGVGVDEARSADSLQGFITADLPILYFLCHGERSGGGTQLALGKRDRISPEELIGWVDVAVNGGRRMWTDPQPLVFINACESLAIAPEDLVNYLSAFVDKAHAVGLIGTEAKVEAGQAMSLAEEFFKKLLEPGATVEDAMRHVRFSFLADGNLFGLMYTPYCFADLSVVHA